MQRCDNLKTYAIVRMLDWAEAELLPEARDGHSIATEQLLRLVAEALCNRIAPPVGIRRYLAEHLMRIADGELEQPFVRRRRGKRKDARLADARAYRNAWAVAELNIIDKMTLKQAREHVARKVHRSEATIKTHWFKYGHVVRLYVGHAAGEEASDLHIVHPVDVSLVQPIDTSLLKNK